MKNNIEVKRERSKVEKCIRHLDATIDLFGNSIKSIEQTKKNNLHWAVIELVNRKNRSINQGYSFSTEGERDIFINRIIEEYQEM